RFGGADIFRLDLVERQRRRIDDARARRAILQQLRRDDGAGIEADRASADEIAAANGDEVGRARAGADEVNGHVIPQFVEPASPSAIASPAWPAASRSSARRAQPARYRCG